MKNEMTHAFLKSNHKSCAKLFLEVNILILRAMLLKMTPTRHNERALPIFNHRATNGGIAKYHVMVTPDNPSQA